METQPTRQECKEAIEKQQRKLNRLLKQYHFDCNHPSLDTDNACLEEMVIEYMFYFHATMRNKFLRKPQAYTSFAALQKIAREKGLAVETDDRAALIRAIQVADKHAPCYALRGSCGQKCHWIKECMYEFFTALEKEREGFFSG